MTIIRRRLGIVTVAMIIVSGIFIARLLSFQFQLDPEIETQLYDIASVQGGRLVEYQPNRGQIYDRDGQVLAVNTLVYSVGISPGAIGPGREPRIEVAVDIARTLDLNELDVYNLLLPDEDGYYPLYVPIANPVSLEQGAALEDLDIPGIVIEEIYLREYPQEVLMDQIIGFVNLESQGYWGIEQQYQAVLAGQSKIATETGLLVDVSDDVLIRDGQDLTLTIDRDAQWIAMQVLTQAVEEQNARGGTIIVMNPETGEILAMVSYPFFTIDEYNETALERELLFNSSIQMIYEPGSIFKVITAAAALDSGVADLNTWTYYNTGCEDIAGGTICDAGNSPGASIERGIVPFSECLVKSLNTCTVRWLIGGSGYRGVGSDQWYEYLRLFGFGFGTGVDLWGEQAGIVNWPNTPQWGENNFAQTSFGQGISVTPLQMLTAANAIANDGLIMQPHIVREVRDGDVTRRIEPSPISAPISAATAQQVLGVMEQAVENEGPEVWGAAARVDGYRVAGKTGTSQKIVAGQYSDDLSWASFIGFIPADDPQLSILIMLDEPEGYWGSSVAAPIFSEIASRLVVVFEIPPESLRDDLLRDGGDPFGRD